MYYVYSRYIYYYRLKFVIRKKLTFANFIKNCENYVVLAKIIRKLSRCKICQLYFRKEIEYFFIRKINPCRNQQIFTCA